MTLSRRGAFVLDNNYQKRITNSKSDQGDYQTESGDISPILSSIKKSYLN